MGRKKAVVIRGDTSFQRAANRSAIAVLLPKRHCPVRKINKSLGNDRAHARCSAACPILPSKK